MARKSSARRYAQAVFEIALERKELDRWQSDLEQIASLGDDAEVIAWLQSSRLRFEVKAKLLAERLSGVNPLTLNLVYLLITKGKLGMVGNIADEYQRLLYSHRGIEPAEVTTAVPLTDEDKQKLKERLGAVIGKEVVLKFEVDSNLIGGIVVRVGGKLIDGSTRRQLLTLKRELVGAGR